MGQSDAILQALLNFQDEEQKRRLARYEAIPNIIPQALNTFITLRDAQTKLDLAKQEATAKYGTPASGVPASVSVGAPPARVRGAAAPLRVMPKSFDPSLPSPFMQAGDPGTIGINDIPESFLTGNVGQELERGTKPVYYRAASPNYRPATMGSDELKLRTDLLPNVEPGNMEAFLTEPSRSKALAGAKPRVRVGNSTMLPVSDELRQRSVATYGYDVFEGMDSIPLSSFNQTLRSSTPKAAKEGDELMDAATTAQLYTDEGMSAEEVKKAPKRLKARDYRGRRARLTAKSKGGILDILSELAASGGAAGGTSAGDATAAGFGF